jgi:hypothetical protein
MGGIVYTNGNFCQELLFSYKTKFSLIMPNPN